MPTPFMHMALAQRLRRDPALPDQARLPLEAAWGAFLLGSIAPDARVSSGMDRAATHFFEYRPVIDPPPVAAMLGAYPMLRRARLAGDAPRLAFVAGYAAHLAMDAVWCTDMLFVHFGEQWETSRSRWHYLHFLLGVLDRRDRAELPAEYYDALAGAEPRGWLPFMTDRDLRAWRDLVAGQLAPGADSLTLTIFGLRINMSEADMIARMDDPVYMAELWRHIPLPTVAAIEERMYAAVRETLTNYFADDADNIDHADRGNRG